MYILCVYVPKTHIEQVKEALFAKGAGSFPGYSKCTWQTEGTGQFMPEAGSNPHLGSINKVETVEEFKVEVTCSNEKAKSIVEALYEAHPYEVPAYHLFEVLTLEDL